MILLRSLRPNRNFRLFELTASLTISGNSSTACSSVTTAADAAVCGSASNISLFTTTDNEIFARCLTGVVGNLNIDGNATGGSNNALKSIIFPLLTYTLGYFQVWNSGNENTALTFFDVHSLAFVGEYFHVQGNSALTLLDLLALTYVGQFFHVGSNAVTAINAPKLTYVSQYFDVDSNGKLTALSLPALTYVGKFFQVNGNSNLVSLSVPVLVKVACQQDACIHSGFAVYLCYNSAGFFYFESEAISHAFTSGNCNCC